MEFLTEQQLQAFLQAPESRQLLDLLQKSNDDAFRHAIQEVRSGNYANAEAILSNTIRTPQAQKLANDLKQRLG